MATKRRETNKKKITKSPQPKINEKTIQPDGGLPPVQEESVNPAKPDKDSFPIVGIGASAGGLEAFENFFGNMPPDSGMAFVLIPHLDPSHKSMMPDLLQRYSRMKVVQAEEGIEVKPNHVYIIPPNRDMSILNGKLVLLDPTESRGFRHPIDFFFRSLAQDQGENAVCIILSGTGTEGTLGLKAVKGEGGLVLVQDPEEAKYDGMPLSAIATGLVDDILPAAKMPGRLLSYVRQALGKLPAPEGRQTDPLQPIYTLIRSHTGHDFSLYKHNTILRRIQHRMALHQIAGIPDYVTYLRNNTHEIDILFKELLIRVTNFFRDKEAFEALSTKALPIITKDKSYDRPVRVWVPGCSTGEEAYSLAIILHEYGQTVKNNFKTQIFATDIDSGAIDIARAGQYADNITVDVSPARLRRYFTRKGNTYKIKDEIREMVVFSVQNLVKDPPFSRLDLISCRNLLIYLGSALQKKIMPVFHYALNPGAVLFLGTSENIGDSVDVFDVLDKKWKIFQTRKTALAPAILNMREIEKFDRGKQQPGTAVKGPETLRINELTEKLLLDQYSPPAVIVNEKGDILYIHGRTGKYLEPASGRANMNIIEMAREGLHLELRASLRKAAKDKKNVRIGRIQVKSNGGFEVIDLDVNYIAGPEHLRGLMLVVFNPVAQTIMRQKASVPKGRAEGKMKERMAELEFELKSTKEHLQNTIEEVETSNEELKSANEELQSSNEELQSTNEELDTSKEELQSVNEELMTVNAELQSKIDELTNANNDMTNLISSTRIATIFLTDDLRIKSFTPEMVNVFNLIDSDVGRPISDIVSKLDYPQLVRDAAEVIRTLGVREMTVKHHTRGWYLTRILPYRTASNVIDGAVITFVDISEQRNAQERIQAALAGSRGIIETVREPLIILDAGLKVMSASRSFYRMFGVSPSETEGKLIYELGNRQWDIPRLRELLEKVLPENSEFNDYDVEHDFPGIGLRKMRLNARRITREGVGTETILLAMEDVTGK